MLYGKGRTHGGHRVVKPRLVKSDDIQISLAEDDVGALGFFCQVQPV